MNLSSFLTTEDNFHDREAMLMHKLIFDARLAFAQVGSCLQVLTGEVDHNGFDIVFDNGDAWRRFQVKTVFGKASSWEIHRRLLRPTMYTADWYGYETSPEGVGLEGGVILQELTVTATNDLGLTYYYNDLDILRAFNLGIIQRSHPKSRKATTSLFDELKRDFGTFRIPKGAFIQANGPSGLLELAGYPLVEGSPVKYWIKLLSALDAGLVPKEKIRLPAGREQTIGLIKSKLLSLTPDTDL